MASTPALAWPVWSLGALFYAYAFFQRVAPSVMVDELMREFALDGAMLGALSAAYFYAYAAFQVPVGILVDRFGPRRLLSGAALVAAAGSLVFATAAELGSATAGRALVGVGAGVSYVATLKLASVWFPPERFGLVAGLTLSAGTLGAVSAQLPLAALVQAFGWRATMTGAAAVAVVLAGAMALLIRDRPAGAVHQGGHAEGPIAGLRYVLFRRVTWLLTAAAALIAAPVLAFAGLWGVPFLAQVQGLERAAAGGATSLMLVAWAVGGPLAGWLSDRLGRRRPVLVGGALVMAACWLPLVARPGLPLPLTLVLMSAIGLAAGVMIVAFAYVRDVFGSIAAGLALGVVNTGVLLAGAAVQTGVGWALDLGWQGATVEGARLYDAAAWRPALAALSALGLIGAAAALALPRRRRHP